MFSLSGSTAAGQATSARTEGAVIPLCRNSPGLDSQEIQGLVQDFLGESVEVSVEQDACIARFSRPLDAEEQSVRQCADADWDGLAYLHTNGILAPPGIMWLERERRSSASGTR